MNDVQHMINSASEGMYPYAMQQNKQLLSNLVHRQGVNERERIHLMDHDSDSQQQYPGSLDHVIDQIQTKHKFPRLICSIILPLIHGRTRVEESRHQW